MASLSWDSGRNEINFIFLFEFEREWISNLKSNQYKIQTCISFRPLDNRHFIIIFQLWFDAYIYLAIKVHCLWKMQFEMFSPQRMSLPLSNESKLFVACLTNWTFIFQKKKNWIYFRSENFLITSDHLLLITCL